MADLRCLDLCLPKQIRFPHRQFLKYHQNDFTKRRCDQKDGKNDFKYGLTRDVEDDLKQASQIEIRDDDMITVGFPRSGNHWAFEVINMILNQTTNFAERTFYSSVLETMGDKIHETLGNLASPRNLTSHNRIQRVPLQAIEKKTKIIYLLRNPKDGLVSFYKLMSGFKVDSFHFEGTWNDFFELQMFGDFPWGSWFDHVLAVEAFMNEHPYCPIYIHVYEEMKQDPVGCIKKLCHFLGKPDAIAEQIATVTEFNNMKKTLLEGKMANDHDHFITEGTDVVFSKGIIGSWKTWFTVAQNEFFDREFEKKMAGSKLGNLVRDYI